MKKVLLYTMGVLMMVSCSTSTFVQVVDVNSDLPTEGDNYVFNDGKIKVTYDLWENLGQAGFMVENLTDQIVYVDLTNSFFVRNGVAYDYYKNRVYSKGAATTVSKAASATAAVLGFWRFTSMPGAKTFAVSESAANSSSSSITVAEKEMEAIPAHCCKFFSEYSISTGLFQDCSVKLFPAKKKPETKTYSEDDSPLTFSNFITYKVGENGKASTIEQKFSIKGYSNYRSKEVKEKITYGCNEQLFGYRNKFASPKRFYIHYDKKQNNDYSADAKKPYQ